MSNLMTLSEELESAAAELDVKGNINRLDDIDMSWPRVVNLLRAKAAALRGKGKPKPKRKTVVGYVGSRHTKVKVQGIFEDDK